MVVLDQKLPTTKYLSYGIWIVVTDKPLTFILNCQSYEPKIGDIKAASPFRIIKLNNTCKTSYKYLQLSSILASIVILTGQVHCKYF